MTTDEQLFESLITRVTSEIRNLLIEKNRSYGNAAFDPVRIFSTSPVEEQFNVRIDDKLSRIARGDDYGEDTELDLIGYLVLKRAYLRYLEMQSVPVEDQVLAAREEVARQFAAATESQNLHKQRTESR
jgi:hypothetical protein